VSPSGAALREQDAATIREAFASIAHDVPVLLELGPAATPVTLLAAGGREVDSLAETEAVVSAVCELSDRVRLTVAERDVPGPWPQVTIGNGLVYRGMPLGYELTSLVWAIVEAGREAPALSPASLARLAELDRPVELRVYVTPT
jgi:alkyl hydroperoxide reductase subunit AhpF